MFDVAYAGIVSVVRRLPPLRGIGRMISVVDRTFGSRVSPVGICPMRLGHSLKLDRRSHTERSAYYTRSYDDAQIELLCCLLRPGDIALDVGGNIGFYAVPLARRLQAIGGTLHVFEPVSTNYTRLCENLELNGLHGSVTTHQYALSSGPGMTDITLREDFSAGSGTGNAAIAFSKSDSSQFSAEKISLRALDDVAHEIGLDTVDLIKVDIEGHEDYFLRGAAETIRRSRAIIYLEVNKPYYRWRGVNLWDTCKEFVASGHVALLPQWRRNAWSSEDSLAGFQRISDLSPCADLDNIFLAPHERIGQMSVLAPVYDH